MRKIQSRDADLVPIKIFEMLDEVGPLLKSIAAGNGKEIAKHQFKSAEYCDLFFTNPCKSWERGSNEKLNGLVRNCFCKSA
ncbi:MAG: IS30 family transposase [Luteibaculaceae bacterium]|jgi:IS30 family transposase